MGCLSDLGFNNFGRGGTAGRSGGNSNNAASQAVIKFKQILARLLLKEMPVLQK